MAEEIVAGIEEMSVRSEEDEEEGVAGKIVVRLPGIRKRRIAALGGEERGDVVGKRETLVKAIPVGPRSGYLKAVVGGKVPSGPTSMFTERGRGLQSSPLRVIRAAGN